MSKTEYQITDAQITDIPEVREIYAHYVKNTDSCLEEKIPSENEMIENFSYVVGKNMPFYVAKIDGKVVGYCYTSLYRTRSAYRYTVEDSIYLNPEYFGKGIAKALLSKAIERCSEIGYKQMVAIVVSTSEHSIKFHKAMGFEEVGTLKNVGYKRNQWLDTIIMQKSL